MRTIPLGQLFELKYGKSLRQDRRIQGEIPVYGSNGAVGFHNESLVSKPTVVVGRKGSIGEVHFVTTPCWPIDTTYFVEPLGKFDYDLEWLFRLLKTLRLQDLNRSAAIPGLNRDDVYRIEIPLPPLDDQKCIAHLLGKVEGLIAQRKQHLQQLDDLLKSVFLEMFGDPVRNEKGWEAVPFHKAGKFVSGGTPSKSKDDFWTGTFPWVSPKDMKVLKIDDATDHISNAVFEETSLKKIAPGHLLIVVRGMILAHSFPVAINTVEIAINQDMKAIKPIKGMNVIYLLNCLVSLKRQILKLISTAGHGTRKFDSIAMQKLFIPKPPENLQNKFVAIAEKIEGLKSRYQQSLTGLESLYGALSQRAFKGELDLSRIPQPTEEDEAMPTIEGREQVMEETTPHQHEELSAPAAESPEFLTEFRNRKHAFEQWLKVFIETTNAEEPVSIAEFMDRAHGNLLELSNEGMLEELGIDGEDELSVSDYDHVKSIIFEMLKKGSLLQTFDDETNTVQIITVKGTNP